MAYGLRQETFTIVLERQRTATEPGGVPPSFTARPLRRREASELRQLLFTLGRQAQAIETVEEAEQLYAAVDRLYELVEGAILGWEGQTRADGEPVLYAPGELDLCIRDEDLGELARGLLANGRLSPEAKKASGSASPSAGAPAGSAEPADTPLRQGSPSSSPVRNAKERVASSADSREPLL